MSNKKPENGRHLVVGVGEAGRTDVMCGTVADNCPVNIYVAVCGRGRRERWYLPILLTPTKKRKESGRRMGGGRLETHVITLPLSTDGWMDGAKKRPSSRRERMCHVFDSTLRLYVQTAHGRADGTVAGCSKWKPLQCCHLAAATAAVCLSLSDGRRRADRGRMAN